MKTTDKIVDILKLNGAQTAQSLAAELGLTSMGVRQHLQALEAEGLVRTEDRAEGRGRPARYWTLTEQSRSLFADRHDELSLQLITSVRQVFGDEGLDKLISHREQQSLESYSSQMAAAASLADKLECLAEIRSREGYMAQIEADCTGFWLLENHCPICAAATSCQNFCRSELALFRQLLGPEVEVSRREHMLDGSRRCAYRIEAKGTLNDAQ
ncbi:MAG: transcriptional regulator [Shewanella algae]|uniref:helix-turn-helix transcriptional regulator n=1 Tax=Shewanella algae TaxID=38313 RepID=UPI000D647A8E|nr:metalloregulator ArsR/SmtB family transcription factor [Shewanella algae]PWF92992.1 transcriptional regulator [Shewanella algae]